jgi:uncharacterized membrane protein
MNKQEFLSKLGNALAGLPKDEIEDRLTFYSEIIDDLVEDGLSEEEAVKSIGTVDEIIVQIVKDIPLSKLVKEKIKPNKKLKAWEIVLLALGSPIWFSLLIALLAGLFSLYISLWAIIVSLWAVFVSFAASSLAGIATGIGFITRGPLSSGLFTIGAALVLAGLSILLFFGCKMATKAVALFTGKLLACVKRLFIKKEEA